MGYEHSDGHADRNAGRPANLPVSAKALIAGGFGAGKTTLVGAVSEILPLQTEEYLTEEGTLVDDLAGVEQKATTTVALDFGRITISDDLIFYLFGVPGQDRFWFVWDELVLGALGAVVLADTRRLESSFASVDFFERRGLPFIVAVNCFEDAPKQYEPADVQLALNLDPHVPVVLCDARSRQSAKEVLLSLIEHALEFSRS
jgi:hypothetical protein